MCNTEPVTAVIKIYICHHKKLRCAASVSDNRYIKKKKKITNIYTLVTLHYGLRIQGDPCLLLGGPEGGGECSGLDAGPTAWAPASEADKQQK